MKRLFCTLSLLLSLSTIQVYALDYDTFPAPPKTTWDEMWQLFLINNDNRISQEIQFPQASFDGQIIDARTADYYQAMYDHAKTEGITLYLRSGYRSIATQSVLYNNSIARYQGMGYSYSNAVTYTERYYTRAGGSEHHLGLAYDIITPEYHNTVYNLTSAFADTAAYRWLLTHAQDYGFIIRYPADRVADTGINFEPWHYRFVGVEHAQYIVAHGLILEEYITLYQMHYPELFGEEPPEEDNGIEVYPPTVEDTLPESQIPVYPSTTDPDTSLSPAPPEESLSTERPSYLDALSQKTMQFTRFAVVTQKLW